MRGSYSLTRRPVHTGTEPRVVRAGGVGVGSPGIDLVFGIIGGNMGRLYDALYDHQETIRAVLVRHEQLASVMAEVYGRLTGRATPSPPHSPPG